MARLTALAVVAGLVLSSCAASDETAPPVASADERAPGPTSPDTDDPGEPEPTTLDTTARTAPDPTPDESGDDPGDDAGAPAWAPTSLTGTGEVSDPARWTVDVLEVRAHDPGAWTQGLEVHGGILYESTGGEGESTVRAVDPDSGQVTHSVDLPGDVYAEGLTVTDGRIVQITWRDEVAYVRDLESFEVLGELDYAGEGWGICDDGSRLVMSDGSETLTFRDRSTFEILGRTAVTFDGDPVALLNELECADGFVLANVWKSNAIVVIDPSTGAIVAVVDAGPVTLDATGETQPDVEVLNGIARVDDATFLLTGKYWPTMYLVRFAGA